MITLLHYYDNAELAVFTICVSRKAIIVVALQLDSLDRRQPIS